MARRSEGWTITADPRTGIYIVRFRHDGGQRSRSTGERDRRGAQKEAARIYEEVTTAHRPLTGVRAPPIEKLFGRWLTAYEATHSQRTADELRRMVGTYFDPHFRSLARFTDATIAEYMRARLRLVSASTVKKELSALRSFLAWCEETHHLAKAPTVPRVPRRATGTAASNQMRVDLTLAQVEAIIAALPEVSAAGDIIRDRVALIWETSLRIATIERLEAPRHYRKGRPSLFVSGDIDKSRYERELPISGRARAILDRHVPREGLLFPPYNIRRALKAASIAAGIDETLAPKVGPHDLRHASITRMAGVDGVSIAGIGYLAGHKTATMTGRYIHAGQDAAARSLAAIEAAPKKRTPKGAKPIVPPSVPRTRKRRPKP